jgi:hypothetical protein
MVPGCLGEEKDYSNVNNAGGEPWP